MTPQTMLFKAVADFSSLSRQSRRARRELAGLHAQATVGGTVVQESITGATGALTNVGNAASRAKKPVKEAASATKKLGKAADETDDLVNKLAFAMAKVGNQSKVANAGVLGLIQSFGYMNTALVAVGAAVAAVGTGLAALGIWANASAEQTQIAFTSILKDGDKAAAVISRIVEIARDTPFGTSDLVAHVRQMIASGFEVEELLDNIMGMGRGLSMIIGDAAAAMGGGAEMIGSMTRAFTRMKATGRVTMEELRILMERGIPAFEILTEELALSADQVRDIGESGVTSAEAIEALARGLDKRFGGAMIAQSETLLGILNTLQDNVQIGLINAFEGLFNTVKPILFKIGELFTQINIDAQELGFFEAIKANLPGIAPVLDTIVELVSNLTAVFQAAGPFISEFVSVLGRIAGSYVMVYLKALSLVLEQVARIIALIPDDVLALAGALLAMSLAGKYAKHRIMGTVDSLKDLMISLRFVKRATAGSGAAMGLFAAKVVIATAGIAALAAGFYYLYRRTKQQAQDAADAIVTSAEAVEGMADSVLRATGEVTKFGKEIKTLENLVPGRDELDPVLENLLAAVEAGRDARVELLAYGESLVAAGVAAGEVADHLEEIAAFALGEEMSFEASDILETSASVERLRVLFWELRGAATEARAAAGGEEMPLRGWTNSILASNIALVKEELMGVGETLGGMADVDPVGLTAALVKMDILLKDLSPERAQWFWDAFAEGADIDPRGITDTASALEALQRANSPLHAEFKETYSSLEANERSAQSLPPHLAAMQRAYGGAGDAAEDAGEQIDENSDATERNAEIMAEAKEKAQEYAKEIETWQKALEDFADPAKEYQDLLKDVSKEEQAKAESAAENAGLSAKYWRLFADEAGVSIEDWMTSLEQSNAVQTTWQANLKKVPEDIARIFRDGGPEMAGALQQLIDAPADVSEELIALLREDAELSTTEMAEKMAAGAGGAMEALIAGLESEDPEVRRATAALVKAIEDEFGTLPASIRGIIAAANRELGRWGLPFLVTPRVPMPGDALGLGHGLHGGIQMSRGAIRVGSGDKLPDQAKIQRGRQLVQWAEPGTGGEAFIPLATSKRKRSAKIWRRTGQLLGLINFAEGGIAEWIKNAGPGSSSLGATRPPGIPDAPVITGGIRAHTVSVRAESAVIDTRTPPPAPQRLTPQDISMLEIIHHVNMADAVSGIENAYENILGRGADPAGLNYWLTQFNSGLLDLEGIRTQFIRSAEGIARHGDLYSPGPNERSVPTVARPVRESGESEADYMDRYNELVEEVTENVWEYNLAHADAARQVAMLNTKMADLQPFSNEWMALMSDRERVIEDQIDAVESAHSRLMSLLNEELDIRESMDDLSEDRVGRQADLEERRVDAIADANKDLERTLQRLSRDRGRREEDIAENLAKRQEDIAENHADRLVDLAEARDDRIEDANKSQARREEDMALALSDRMESIIEQRNDALVAEDERLAEAMENRVKTLMRSLDPLKKYEEAWANTTTSIIDNIQEQNAAFATTQRGLEELRARGISRDTIDILGLDSPKNAEQLSSLLASSQDDLDDLEKALATRRTFAERQVADSGSDLLADSSERKDAILSDAQDALGDAQEDFERSLLRSRDDFSVMLGDIDEMYQESVADAAETRAEALADASEAYAEAMSDLAEDFAEREADLAESHSENLLDITIEFNESMADLDEAFAESMADLEAELAGLGVDAGSTYAEAIADGMRSNIPGVRAAAQELQDAIRQSSLVQVMPTPGLPPLGDPTPPNLSTPGMATTGDRSYVVKRGDTLSGIAKALLGDAMRYPQLAAANHIINPDLIYPGQVIRYHQGGEVGTIRQNEVLARLERGEGVLSSQGLGRLNTMFSAAQFGGGDETINLVVELDGDVVYRAVKKRQRSDQFLRHVVSGSV